MTSVVVSSPRQNPDTLPAFNKTRCINPEACFKSLVCTEAAAT